MELPEGISEESPFFNLLPQVEQKIIGLLSKGLTQKEIAVMEGVTQGAVSSRLYRSLKRLRYLKQLHGYDLEKMEQDLSTFLSPLNVAVIKTMIQTSCQTDTAEIVNGLFNLQGQWRLNQMKVRHRFHKAYKVLVDKAKENPSYVSWIEVMDLVKNHLYFRHEIVLPHYYRG